MSEKERDKVFDTLCSERFVDRSPAEVVATLLDEDVYLCSERTMYRVLASQVPVRERRAQRSQDVDYIFGIPGEENIDMMDVLLDSPIRFITTRHE